MAARATAGGMLRLRLGGRHAVVTGAALLLAAALLLLLFVRPGWDGGPTLSARLDLGRFAARLRGGRAWLGPFLALAAAQPLLRALVWWALLPPPRARLADAYHATALGALVHNAVPGKLGPLAAAWILARASGRPVAPALSTQLVAKLLELGAVVVLGAVAAARAGAPPALGGVVVTGAVLFLALSGAAGGLALGAPRLAARVAGRLPRAGAALAGLGDGLTATGRAGRLAPALALAALPAGASLLAWAIPLRAAGAAGGLAGAALLVAVVTFGQLTPGLPVGAAVTWTLAAWAARQLGAGEEAAAALAILGDAGMIAASVGMGLLSAAVRRDDLRALLRRRRAPPEPPDP